MPSHRRRILRNSWEAKFRVSGFEFQSLEAKKHEELSPYMLSLPISQEGTQARRYLRMPSFEMTVL